MSDKITKTVVFEIEPSGDCFKCKPSIKFGGVIICPVFDRVVGKIATNKFEPMWKNDQCQACRNYLAEIKSRVEQGNDLDMSEWDKISLIQKLINKPLSVDRICYYIGISKNTYYKARDIHFGLYAFLSLKSINKINNILYNLEIGVNKCKD